MAEQPHPLRIDLGAAAEKVSLGDHVGGEVGRGIEAEPSLSAEPAVVATQDGDPLAGEMVGNDPEQLEAEDLLVAILGAAAGDHDDRRKGACSRGDRQRPG